MLFAFIDESGHPHPKDSSTHPVLVSVCIDAENIRRVNTELFKLKRRILQRNKGDFEAKAKELITRGTFRNRPEKREFVESFFEMVRNLQLVIFAIIMERPISVPPTDIDFLPMQFRHLLYRINRLLVLEGDARLGAIFFDGNGTQYNNLAVRFSNWLYRSRGGQSLTNLVDSPFFVDSRYTPGIQIADMAASVIRIHHEKQLHRGVPSGDAFLSAINRYCSILVEKTVDLETLDGFVWYGFDRMAERLHAGPTEPEEEYTSNHETEDVQGEQQTECGES